MERYRIETSPFGWKLYVDNESEAEGTYLSPRSRQHLADAFTLANSAAQLKAERDELVEALTKMLALVARGYNEKAYENIVAGPDYAKRCMDRTSALLERLS